MASIIIRIRKPANSGSTYFNYKQYFSILLLAVVDADLRFQYIEVGAEGSCSELGIFSENNLLEGLEYGTARVPQDEIVRGDTVPTPYFFVADACFGLRTWML